MSMLEMILRVTHRIGTRVNRRRSRHGHVGADHLWEKKRAFQSSFLRKAGLRPEHRLLDIGCGTLRGGIPLIEYLDPGNYHGVDVRAEVLEEAKKELAEAGLEAKKPVLHHAASLGSLALPVDFDTVWAFSVLMHMPDEEVKSCMRLVAGALAPGGQFLANVRVGAPKNRGNWKGQFPINQRPMEFYAGAAKEAGLEVEDLGSLWSLGHRTYSPGDLGRMLKFRRAAS